MAERTTSMLHTLLFLAFSLYLQSSLCDETATILDVSTSIKKTFDVLSFNLQEEPTSNFTLTSLSVTSSFSLSLHSRSSIFPFSFSDYESLILSRLARDTARVNSILYQLNSSTATSSSKGLVSPLISGAAQGSGEYFARIGIGFPVKTQYWIIDTGSDVSWLQCLPCENCYKQSGPIYNPSASFTYRSLPCGSARCQALTNPSCVSGRCQYKVSYGDGSSTAGDYITETLSFGWFRSVTNLAVGCGHDNQGLFVGAAGLIGLGGGQPSLPSQLSARSFSYCLVDHDSTRSSTLEFNTRRRLGYYSITTRLVSNPRFRTYRYLEMVDMSVGGRRLNIPSSLFALDGSGRGGTLIDTGTTVTRLTALAYNALRDEFVRQASDLRKTSSGFEILDTCYSLSSGTARIPTVSFVFPGNQILTLPAENILFPVDSRGTFCLAFAPTNSVSIIGNIQQQTIRVNYDLVNSLVVFAPRQC